VRRADIEAYRRQLDHLYKSEARSVRFVMSPRAAQLWRAYMLERAATILGGVAILVTLSWFLFETHSTAGEANERSRSNREINDSLVRLHERQQAAEEAESKAKIALIRDLCLSGRLPPQDCAQYGVGSAPPSYEAAEELEAE
jgi:hypothetical protein